MPGSCLVAFLRVMPDIVRYQSMEWLQLRTACANNTRQSFPVAIDQYGLSAMVGVRVGL